jgi:hypothetical protein
MTRIIFFILIAFFTVFSTGAQVAANKNPKAYKSWVRLHDTPGFEQGILLEVGDSSIFVSKQLFHPQITEYHFRNIDLIKIQRDKSIRRGMIKGSAIGFGGGIIISSSILGGPTILAAPLAIVMGLTTAIVGTGFGALAGTIKDRITINSDFENFEKYKANLMDYSFKQEEMGTLKKFRHRWFGGVTLGVSFPFDEFLPNAPIADYPGMRRIGDSGKMSLGYRFNDRFGIAIAGRSNTYHLEEDYTYNPEENNSERYWGYSLIMAGPVLSLPFSERFSIELNPNAGFAGASFMDEYASLFDGIGLGININGTLVYNISKRWNMSLDASYNSSTLDFGKLDKGKFQAFDLGFGMAYKFGRNSL